MAIYSGGFIFVLVTSLFLMLVPVKAEYRIWEGRDGGMIEAELLSKTDETVELLKRDGNKASVPISMLSDDDQKYLRGNGGKDSQNDRAIEEQLKRLKAMYANELITTEVYEKMQQDLLSTVLPDSRGTALAKESVNLQDGLVLCFSFNAPAVAVIKDESGNGNDGRAHKVKWVENGWIGGAYQFAHDHPTQGIRVEDNDSLDCTSITMAAWIKTDDTEIGWNRIFDKDWREGYCLTMCDVMPEDSIPDRFAGMASMDMEHKCWLPTNRKVNDGKWHHIVGTYGDGYKRIYVDGQICNEERIQGIVPLSVNKYDLMIGNSHPKHHEQPGEKNAFNGLIDEVRIYNRALNPDEVTALFALNE